MKKTQQQKYLADRKADGVIPMRLMIPIGYEDKAKAYAKRLRKAAKCPLPQD